MTIEELKRHPYFPFRDFATNDLSFLLLEIYWAEIVRIAVSSVDAESSAWIVAAPADRAEGNPILQIIDRTSSPPRQLRIIQRFNLDALPELDLEQLSPVKFSEDAYVPFVPGLTYNALDDDGTSAIEELVISSDISEPCERLNKRFIEKWCISRVSISLMEEMLLNYWNIVESNLIQDNP